MASTTKSKVQLMAGRHTLSAGIVQINAWFIIEKIAAAIPEIGKLFSSLTFSCLALAETANRTTAKTIVYRTIFKY